MTSKPANMFIIFWDFLMVEQISLSPQAKQSAVIDKAVPLRVAELLGVKILGN